MTTVLLLAIAIFGIAVLVISGSISKRVRRPMNQHQFQTQWEELLKVVGTQEGMVVAVINADKLVDKALTY